VFGIIATVWDTYKCSILWRTAIILSSQSNFTLILIRPTDHRFIDYDYTIYMYNITIAADERLVQWYIVL